MSDTHHLGSIDTVIVWFRRDLRVDDNPALVAAVQAARNVIPVFIWAAEEEGQFQPGRCSRWWLKQSLSKFQRQVQSLGSRLIIRRADDSSRALQQLVHETGAQALFFNHLYDPISLVRDHEVKQGMARMGVVCRSYNADLLYEPWEILDEHEEPFTCFEDFWNKVLSMPYQPPFPLPAPTRLPAVPAQLNSMDLQQIDFFMTPEQEASSEQLKFKWKPGLEGAIDKLEAFLANRLLSFEHDRAKVDRESTSQLSPWIHQGTISVRYIYYRVRQKQAEWLAQGVDKGASCLDFIQQMGYREYSRYLSFHFPFLAERALLAHLRAVPWKMDHQNFKAWKQGMTGYPLVDAAMKMLWSTGWCHNRMRVVAGSFMVKNLLLPWQWGLKHYWDALLDADLECDALGWQYVAGCMSDAHPFGYMIDLEAEASRFDPDGEFVRRWIPVLSRLPTKYIHQPWKAPPNVLAAADIELGFNYPFAIVSSEESKSNVSYACNVIEKCLSHSSGSHSKHPYRPPTDPSLGQYGPHQTSLMIQSRPSHIPRAPRSNGDSDRDETEQGPTGALPAQEPRAIAASAYQATGRPEDEGEDGEEAEPSGGGESMQESDEEVLSNSISYSVANSTACSSYHGREPAGRAVQVESGRTVPTMRGAGGSPAAHQQPGDASAMDAAPSMVVRRRTSLDIVRAPAVRDPAQAEEAARSLSHSPPLKRHHV